VTSTDLLALDLAPPPGGQTLHHTDRATIIWGDSRDPQVIAQAPDWYGLLCTDPPYGIRYNSGRSNTFTEIAGDDGSIDWPAILGQWAGPEGTYTRGLQSKRHVYVFGYSAEQLAGPLRLGGSTELIWDKLMCGMGNLERPWGPGHERITFGVHIKQKSQREKDGGGRLSARLRKGSVLRYARPNGDAVTRHSNEKPWPLLAELIESSTVRGDLVVDPCAGSGSTGVAAVLEGRRCFLVEVDRANAELCVERVVEAERIADLMRSA
jgi:site-specific DNA-methyltransferase (adenine-specific)